MSYYNTVVDTLSKNGRYDHRFVMTNINDTDLILSTNKTEKFNQVPKVTVIPVADYYGDLAQ